MFAKLFKRAAAKACLINIKFDLDRMRGVFPHCPSAASKTMFTLMENISLAFGNGASVEEVRVVIRTRAGGYPATLRDILDSLVDLAAAVERNDLARVSECDRRINDLFHQATATRLDITQLPWLSKLAVKTGR